MQSLKLGLHVNKFKKKKAIAEFFLHNNQKINIVLLLFYHCTVLFIYYQAVNANKKTSADLFAEYRTKVSATNQLIKVSLSLLYKFQLKTAKSLMKFNALTHLLSSPQRTKALSGVFMSWTCIALYIGLSSGLITGGTFKVEKRRNKI